MTEVNTVFVVDDDDDFRESMIWLLTSQGYSTESFNSGEAFLSCYQGQKGCLLLDVRMTNMSGLTLQQELNRQGWLLPVIIITGHGDVTMAVQAMKNGAVDFIEKPFDDRALIRLIEHTFTQTKDLYAKQELQQQVLQCWSTLSQRERQVAELVTKGLSNRQLAEELGISIKTIEIHRSRVMKKMHVVKVAELVNLKRIIIEFTRL